MDAGRFAKRLANAAPTSGIHGRPQASDVGHEANPERPCTDGRCGGGGVGATAPAGAGLDQKQ